MAVCKVGDKVFAARKQIGSSLLGAAQHVATVLAFSEEDRRGNQMVTVKYDQEVENHLQVDIIKYVPEGRKGSCATIVALPPQSDPSPQPVASSQESTASSASAEASSQESTASSASADFLTQPFQAPLLTPTELHPKRIPKDFKNLKAPDILPCDVPTHVIDRWKQIDDKMRVGKLFQTTSSASTALRDVQLLSLKDTTGVTNFEDVPVRTNNRTAPDLGLTEIFMERNVLGHTMRAESKGMKFFFLMCLEPEKVKFPPRVPATAIKRGRAPTFSLSEMGRLVGLLSDTRNVSVVSMLMKKWSRADVDAKAGKPGVAHYWDQIAGIFNDKSYAPPECVEFADHVRSCGPEYVYKTSLVPEHRVGNYLRQQWRTLRADYGIFYNNYDRSGHHNADPTCYTQHLPVLLMHYTWNDSGMQHWAAKTIEEGSFDDSGLALVYVSCLWLRVHSCHNGHAQVPGLHRAPDPQNQNVQKSHMNLWRTLSWPARRCTRRCSRSNEKR